MQGVLIGFAVGAVVLVGVFFVSSERGSGGPPIYFVVFDEFSTEVLLSDEKRIDARTFPNFARLAERAHWFRNGTAASTETQFGLPAILTGGMPAAEDRRMTHESYPVNICTLLYEGGYSIHAVETNSTLCDRAAGAPVSRMPMWLARARKQLTEIREADTQERAQVFLNWVSRSEGGRNQFNLIHSLLPHAPYEYTPGGDKHGKGDMFDYKRSDASDVWESLDEAGRAYELYWQQARYTDVLLGRLLDTLESEEVFNEAVIVVTADHGVTYREGANRRFPILSETGEFADALAAMDMLKVPLFIKTSGQTEGSVVDSRATTLDVAPTLMGLVSAESGSFDGGDLIGDSGTGRQEYIVQTRSHTDRSTIRRIDHHLDILDDEYKPHELKARYGLTDHEP